MAASICLEDNPRGSFGNPSFSRPAAMAPEETRMIWWPSVCSCVTCRASSTNSGGEMWGVPDVRVEVPTLTIRSMAGINYTIQYYFERQMLELLCRASHG